jgi:hypothetical protein
MRGLKREARLDPGDPRIHQKSLFKKMDCRVKPGNDI